MKRLKHIIKRIFSIIGRNEMLILPGNIAFFIVLSIIPIILLVCFILSLFSVPISIADYMKGVVPQSVIDLLVPFFSKGLTLNVGIFTIVGLILASNGPDSIIIASNELYGIKQQKYLNRRIKAIFMTIILVVLVVLVAVLLAFGNNILKSILSLEVFENASSIVYPIIKILKWPLSFILIFYSVKLIYTLCPSEHIPSMYMAKGSMFTTIGWICVTAIYSYYVNNFASYDAIYGSLSSIIILMMWIFILSYILVIGMVINSTSYEYHKLKENESIKEKEEEINKEEVSNK